MDDLSMASISERTLYHAAQSSTGTGGGEDYYWLLNISWIIVHMSSCDLLDGMEVHNNTYFC